MSGWAHSARAILELAWARQRARPARFLVVVAGVAAAAAVLVAVLGGGTAAADLRQRADLRALPDENRAFRVVLYGTAPEGGLVPADRAAKDVLAPLTQAAPIRSVALRDTNLGGGGAVALAAVDDFERWVTLERGRPPGSCRPERCEVVQVLGDPIRPAPIEDARLVVVGAGRVTNPLLLGSDRLARTKRMLVGADTDGLSSLPGLSFVYRNTTWTAPLDPDAIHPWQVDALLDRSADASRSLAQTGLNLQLTGPDREIVAARDAGRTATGRLLLVGAAGSALVVAFALLAASMLRGDHEEDRRRLELRGATRAQRLLFTVAERGWMSLAGMGVGVLAGVAIVALVARASNLPVAGVLAHSVATPTGLILLVGAWIACSLLLAFAGSGGSAVVRIGPFVGSDLVAAGALAATALAASRGGASPDRLARGDVDPLLPALPLLIALAAGALALRVTGPLLRWAERHLGQRGGLAMRLAVLAQARRPRRVAMTVAFLVVTIGLAIFTTGYRATLTQGQRDQASFAVPVDLIARAGPALAEPLDLATLDQFGADGDAAFPVIRSAASIRGASSQPLDATMLGLPAGELARLDGWRADFADSGRRDLAARLGADAVTGTPGIPLPPDARSIALDARRSGLPFDITAIVKLPSGRSLPIPLSSPQAAVDRLTATVPGPARGGRIIGLRFALSRGQQLGALHQEAEGRGGDVVGGRIRLAHLTADGAPLDGLRGWIGSGGARTKAGPEGVTVDYRLGPGQQPVLRPPSPADRAPLPMLVSRDIAEAAGAGSEIIVSAGPGREVRGRVVAAASRFPTLGDDPTFIVADESALESALDAADPGAGRANEVWIDGRAGPPAIASQVGRPPFNRLILADHAAVLRGLERDPLARGVLWTLWGITAIALVLGIAALALASATDVRDERRELADLEAQGLAPRTLRGQLRLRGAVPLLLGTVGGVALGTGLVALVVRLVLLTAGSETPVPPLARAVDWPLVVGLLAGYLAVGAIAVAQVTWQASRRGALA